MFRERVLLRKNSDKRFREQQLCLQAGCLAAIAQESGVEFALQKFLHNGRRIGLMQLQVHLWIKSAVVPQHNRYCGQHRGTNKSHSQKTFFTPTDAARLLHVLLNIPECPFCSVQKNFSGACELHGARGS